MGRGGARVAARLETILLRPRSDDRPTRGREEPLLQEQDLQANWKFASEEYAKTTELVMMGFSLPPTDLIVGSLLATTRRDDMQLTPVNTDAAIVDRLSTALQISGGQVRADFAGSNDPIRAWVDANVS